MKFKVDQYAIFNKGRTYNVLVFPRMENAWAFFDNDDYQIMIDGDREFYTLIRLALAALIADPSKIIYFPIKHPGETSYGAHMTFDAVLLRPELQFRRSEWYDLKPKLDKRHRVGKYTIRYDPQKIEDYQRTHYKLGGRRKDEWTHWIQTKVWDSIVEDLLGDTAFLVLPKDACYMHHHKIMWMLDRFDETEEYGSYAGIGYILPKRTIEEFFGK